jgi:hypothetical protein
VIVHVESVQNRWKPYVSLVVLVLVLFGGVAGYRWLRGDGAEHSVVPGLQVAPKRSLHVIVLDNSFATEVAEYLAEQHLNNHNIDVVGVYSNGASSVATFSAQGSQNEIIEQLADLVHTAQPIASLIDFGKVLDSYFGAIERQYKPSTVQIAIVGNVPDGTGNRVELPVGFRQFFTDAPAPPITILHQGRVSRLSKMLKNGLENAGIPVHVQAL